MNFSLDRSLEILGNTPSVISAILNNLSAEWTTVNEGENTWTVKEVVAHLILCEETDWLPRVKIILSDSADKTFAPIDMKAHFVISNSNSLESLIARFTDIRERGLKEIGTFSLIDTDLMKTARHPKLGELNLQNLIAAWVTHDLTHIAQIARIMAKQNKELVGPFELLLKILKA